MSSLSTAAVIPVARPYIGSEEETAVVAVLRSGWLTQGARVAEFEQRFSEYIGCDFAIAVSSCTTALHLALHVLGIGAGDEVICPSLSFIATANSIAYTGATPVFCDVALDTYNLDPAKVEQAISPRTKAILVVHQIGLPAAMDELLEIAARHNLPVVEDAACAIGAEYGGQRIGRPLGTMACFSFHPRKILTTGEGGMITTSDPALAERLRRIRQHAMSLSDVARHSATKVAAETYDELGYNYRMTDLQAAVGLVQLQRLPEFLARRRELAGRYTAALSQLPWLQVPVTPDLCRHNYQSYMVRLLGDRSSRRDALMQELLEKGVSTRRAIMAIHHERPYRSDRWDGMLPQTECVAATGLILPLFHGMTEDEQDVVIEALYRF